MPFLSELPALTGLPQSALLALEIGVLGLLCLAIGLWAGRRMARGRARREAAVYNSEMRRTQSRLRAAERQRASGGRRAYGSDARKRARG
jgi:hypothetical protein